MSKIRKWLKIIRKHKKITQKEVVEQCGGLSRSFYTMIENGTKNPSLLIAKKISNYLGCSWTWFYEAPSEEQVEIFLKTLEQKEKTMQKEQKRKKLVVH